MGVRNGRSESEMMLFNVAWDRWFLKRVTSRLVLELCWMCCVAELTLGLYGTSETDTEVWSGVLGPIQRRSGRRFKPGAKESG